MSFADTKDATQAGPATAFTFKVEVGAPQGEIFLISGWNVIEGPHPQFGPICQAPFRWAAQGAALKLPLAPNADNRITLRADPPNAPGQRLIVKLDGEPLADWPRTDSLEYTTVTPAQMVGSRSWATLSLHNSHPVKFDGDTRDTAVAIQWVEVSSQAARNHPAVELLKEQLTPDAWNAAPTRWRYRYDPVDCGEVTTPNVFWKVLKETTGWQDVDNSFQPQLHRGDVCWFRTMLAKSDSRRAMASIAPPGKWGPLDDVRAWVNGDPVSGEERELARHVARRIAPGVNLIVYRVVKGPQPKVQGRPFTAPPAYSGRWSGRSVWISPGLLEVTSGRPRWIEASLIAPNGRVLSRAKQAVIGRRADFSRRWFTMPQFGQYWLLLRDDQGRRVRYPVFHLGIHHFHWGWYSAYSGTGWNGFTPCSNDHIDELMGRLDDWKLPHHSITWQGCILAPGTGFHRTQGKDYIRAFREAIRSGKLQFVGSTWQPRNVCTDFGESMVRSLRWSRNVYRTQLNDSPHVFCSHDSTLTPQQPQILRMLGYDSLVMIDNWWGQGQSAPAGNDLTWRAPDGSSVRTADSWYHGTRPLAQARRAIRCGKNAILCHEEFACLDRTVFLEPSDREQMAKEGILVTPVSLEEYLKLTEAHAKARLYTGESNLCHKGWTGGGPEEVEYEKINRLLESRLVALDNLIAWAAVRGIRPLPDTSHRWDMSMRWHECHNHWGNGYPELTREMARMLQQTERELVELASRLAQDAGVASDGTCLVNPNGFETGGPLELRAPRWARSIRLPDGTFAPIQHGRSSSLAALPPLPRLSLCGARWSVRDIAGVGARRLSDGRFEMRNALIRVVVSPDGRYSVYDRRTGRVILSAAGAIWAGKPKDQSKAVPVSTEDRPLNLDAYGSVRQQEPARLLEAGPARASVVCRVHWPGYDNVSASVQISVCAAESMVRVTLRVEPSTPWHCAPAEGQAPPHEGTYMPSLFVQFPVAAPFQPEADMAYCVSKGVLPSTNAETFFNIPFRWHTFNALSMAAPQGGRFVVLTRGLHDFMAFNKPSPYLGLALANTAGGCPISRPVRHEYAVLVRQSPGHLHDAEAYTAAQALLSSPVAVSSATITRGQALTQFPLVKAEAGVIVTGVEVDTNELRMRTLNLTKRGVRCTAAPDNPWSRARVYPGGHYTGVLPSQAVREWRVTLPRDRD